MIWWDAESIAPGALPRNRLEQSKRRVERNGRRHAAPDFR
jgi:hypothetical protein